MERSESGTHVPRGEKPASPADTDQGHRLPRVAVVVLHWNNAQDTSECLDSLRKDHYDDLKVFVVDNGSKVPYSDSGNSSELWIEVIRNNRNLGFPGGMNVGIRRAMSLGADVVVCLNNDTVVEPDFIAQLSAAYRAFPAAGAFAPLELEYGDGGQVVSLGGSTHLLRSTVGFYGASVSEVPDAIAPTEMLCGACLVLSSSTLAAIGGLDESYFFGFEDRAYAIRIMRSGRTIVGVPRARFRHKRAHSTPVRFNSMRAYFETRNWILFARREFPTLACGALALYLTFAYLPYLVCTSIPRRRPSIVTWSLKGILWHINAARLPADDAVVEALAQRSE